MMETILQEGLTALSLSTDGIPALVRYAGLLAEKNKVMNLTAINDPSDVARLHFLDSAALLTLYNFQKKAVIDIGTGAGFPGLPLRILEPSLRLTLLDAQNKRVDFLRDVCQELKLEDVVCVHERAEAFSLEHRESFDIAVSRAVAALPLLAELCLPLVKVGGTFLAMKSVDSSQELDASGRAVRLLGGQLQEPLDYTIPGTDLRHRLVIIKKLRKHPKNIPGHLQKLRRIRYNRMYRIRRLFFSGKCKGRRVPCRVNALLSSPEKEEPEKRPSLPEWEQLWRSLANRSCAWIVISLYEILIWPSG